MLHRSKLRVLIEVFALAAACGSCSDSDSAPVPAPTSPPTQAEIQTALVSMLQTVCRRVTECCTMEEQGYFGFGTQGFDACVAWFSEVVSADAADTVIRSITAGRVVYRPERLQGCLDAWKGSCNAAFGRAQEFSDVPVVGDWLPACAAFEGQVAPDGSCVSPRDCAQDGVCDTGSCSSVKVAVGGKCKDGFDCVRGLFCAYSPDFTCGTCQTRRGDGASCAGCDDGRGFCESNGTLSCQGMSGGDYRACKSRECGTGAALTCVGDAELPPLCDGL